MSAAKRNIALVLVASAVAQSFGRFTWGILLPAIETDLLDGYGTAGTLGTVNVASYLVGSAAVSTLSGRLLPSRLMRVGLVMSTSGLTVLALAGGVPALFTGHVLAGLGGAFIWIPAPGLASAAVPPDQRGRAMGFVSLGIGLGIFLTSQFTNVLRLWLGEGTWRPIYGVEAVIGLLTLLAVTRWLIDDPEAGGTAPVRVDVLRTVPGWRMLSVAYASFGLGYSIFVIYLVAALEEDAGFSGGHAALVYSIFGVAVIAGGLLMGRLSDRFGRRAVLRLGFGVMALCVLSPLVGAEPVVTIGAVLVGLCFSGLPPVLAAVLRDHLDPRSFGAAFGALTLAFGVGQVLGPQIGGWLGESQGDFALAFVVSAAALAVGALSAWLMPPAEPLTGVDAPSAGGAAGARTETGSGDATQAQADQTDSPIGRP